MDPLAILLRWTLETYWHKALGGCVSTSGAVDLLLSNLTLRDPISVPRLISRI